MTTLADLTKPLTRAEVEEKIYAAIAARGGKVTSWKPVTAARTIIFGVSIILAGLSQLSALIARSGFLELSEGDWLTLVARYVYGVERDLGTFATGTVVVDNSLGGVYSGGPDELVFVNTAVTPNKTYRNTAAYSIGANETGVEIAVRAVELGSDSTAGPGDIDAFETTLLGLSVTNPTALVGRDREEDPALRTRCYEKTGTLSPNGPADAYAYVCKTATREDGSAIGITRVRTTADGEGGVTVYVADDDGPPDSGDLDVLQELVDEAAEPNAVTATVAGATPVAIAVTYEVWVRDNVGLDTSEIEALVDARLIEFMRAQPIGGVKLLQSDTSGKVFVSAIQTVIGSVVSSASPTATPSTRREVRVVVTVPAADVELDVDEVPALGSTTPLGIHQVGGGVL